MSADPGPVLAQGRASIIYDLRDGTVLRRYVGSDRSAESEAEVMRLAADAGVSVPVVHSANGPDIRMDLVPSPTMLSDLGGHRAGPGTTVVLADLHASLDHVRPRAGSDLRLVHGDLHPGNVVLSEHGPVLLDWTNHRFGYRALDFALTWLVLACFAPDPTDEPPDAVRAALLEGFLGAVDRSAAAAALDDAATIRRAEPATTRSSTHGSSTSARLIVRVRTEAQHGGDRAAGGFVHGAGRGVEDELGEPSLTAWSAPWMEPPISVVR